MMLSECQKTQFKHASFYFLPKAFKSTLNFSSYKKCLPHVNAQVFDLSVTAFFYEKLNVCMETQQQMHTLVHRHSTNRVCNNHVVKQVSCNA